MSRPVTRRAPKHMDYNKWVHPLFELIISLVAECFSARVDMSYFNVADTSRGTGKGQIEEGWWGVGGGWLEL